ncbi:hypothetical protein BVC80_1271g10 [Macleaya cordata]|uniref:Uncharacterized protein n=1 Tax=Macleaya cordata TaxID=56857 RepID=A0A200PZY9_MACCD|nr:hypothetical protein BVC80_1271g10 [Macleaya cordata]
MAAYEEDMNNQQEGLITKTQIKGSIYGWSSRRKILLKKRRKIPSVRLGGKKQRRGFYLVKLFRKIKLRWLKLQYSCMLKKLKSFYYSVVKDLIEAGAALETVQQRIMMETYFSVPVMGVSIASIPSYAAPKTGLNRVH